MKINLVLSLLLFSLQSYALDDCNMKWKRLLPNGVDSRYTTLVGKCDQELKRLIGSLISTNTNSDYDSARMAMYAMDTNEFQELCSYYTTNCVKYKSGNPDNFNTEHTWPQSKGAKGIARADIHHLYSVDIKTNAMRGNLPFCEVKTLSRGVPPATETGSAVGRDVNGRPCFEPKGEHKGEVARSMFYFSIRYSMGIDDTQESYLRTWNGERDVTQTEETRNNNIERFQHNRNPFVDYPEFVELIGNF